MMRRSVALLLLTTLLPLSRLANASQGGDYRKLVDDYRRYGASAVPRAVALTDDQITPGRHALAGSWEELRAAAMLHTEATLSQVNDGHPSQATRHLDIAVSLFDDVVKASPPQRDFAYRWYRVTEYLLRQFRAPASANALARKAKDRFPEAFLATRKAFDEAMVFELQGCTQGSAPSAQRFGDVDGVQLLSRWFLPAARLFEEVLDRDPKFLAAALHLGRLNMLEERLDKAADFFERALEAVDPRVRYLAGLYLGSLDERADRLEQAEKRYRTALAEYPWGQSAQLALAQVLSRTGRDAEARTLVLTRFGGGQPVIEPLWTYVFMPGQELGALFDELRAEIAR